MSSVGDAAFSSITEDNRHIVEYIRGYILRRLKQKFSNQLSKQYQFLTELCDDGNNNFGHSSLIEVLNNSNYQTLIKPISSLTEMLLYIEFKFRQHGKIENILKSVMESINMDYLYNLLSPVQIDHQCLLTICKVFVKIR